MADTYCIEPADRGQYDVIHVSSGRRQRAQSKAIAILAVACLEAGAYFTAQLLLRSPIATYH